MLFFFGGGGELVDCGTRAGGSLVGAGVGGVGASIGWTAFWDLRDGYENSGLGRRLTRSLT